MAKLKDIFGPHHGLDDRSVEALVRALERKNLSGFDYLEFKQSLNALRSMDMEGETAFKSAFATATVMGLTKEKLIETANHYKRVLTDEQKQFEASMQRHLQQRVESKLKEVEILKRKVAEYQEKIQQLETQISTSQQTIDEADSNIASEREKIESTKENFDFTLRSIMNEIDKDLEDIETYL